MEKVYSITEAYSQQPCTMFVGMKAYPSKEKVNEIRRETVAFKENGQDNFYEYYVGYSESGKKLFQFLCHTVNVIFE